MLDATFHSLLSPILLPPQFLTLPNASCEQAVLRAGDAELSSLLNVMGIFREDTAWGYEVKEENLCVLPLHTQAVLAAPEQIPTCFS